MAPKCCGHCRQLARQCRARGARFKGDDSVLKQDGRTGAGCLPHARRNFDELIKVNQSPAALQAAQRKALIYCVEREAHALTAHSRLIRVAPGGLLDLPGVDVVVAFSPG